MCRCRWAIETLFKALASKWGSERRDDGDDPHVIDTKPCHCPSIFSNKASKWG